MPPPPPRSCSISLLQTPGHGAVGEGGEGGWRGGGRGRGLKKAEAGGGRGVGQGRASTHDAYDTSISVWVEYDFVRTNHKYARFFGSVFLSVGSKVKKVFYMHGTGSRDPTHFPGGAQTKKSVSQFRILF